MPSVPPPKKLNPGGKSSSSDFLLCSRHIEGARTGFQIKVKQMELKFGEEDPIPQKNECCAPKCKKDFWWAPKPTKAQKKNPPPPEPYKNVMYDRRVIRGIAIAGKECYEVDPFDDAAVRRRDKALSKKQLKCRNLRNVLGTPPPVKGRLHETMQTDKYLEELVVRPPELDVETQTDIFLEKVPTPPYVHEKVGIDVGTQIEEGELFHFDAEAQPLIEILVDGAIEQSILEVVHEQELEALRRKADEYLAQREAELAELRRLEAEEIRLQAEKERRLRQDDIANELDKEIQQGVIAAKLLQGHIASLLPEIINNLEPATAAVKKDYMMKELCPWLAEGVQIEAHHIVDSRRILMSIVREIIKERAIIYMNYREPMGPPLEALDELEAEEGELCCLECCECISSDSTICPSYEDKHIL